MKKQEQVQRLKETLYVTLGAFILAISVNLIFLPNQIVAGGASGLSIVLNELFVNAKKKQTRDSDLVCVCCFKYRWL